MKILCVIDSLGSGGAQRQMVELALGFKERGNSVIVLTYRNISFYNSFLENAGITIICLDESNYLRRVLRIVKYIRKGRFDAVLSFLEASNFICEIAGLPRRKWRLVVGERNADPSISKSFRLIVYRWFHFFADYIVANSLTNLGIVRKVNPFLRKSKCMVIYNAINFNRFKPDKDYTPRINSHFNLVVVARQAYQKNLIGLVNALTLLTEDEKTQLKITWYGDREKSKKLLSSIDKAHQLIKDKGLESIFAFKPPVKKIESILQQADAVGLFSLFEGFPNTICEGMSCGKPVICTNVADMSSLLSYDHQLLMNPNDPLSIKNTLLYILNFSPDQLADLGLKNEEIAKAKFEREAIINKYLLLLGKESPLSK